LPPAATITVAASPSNDGTTKNARKGKTSAIEEQRFAAGYRAAYATIYDRQDFVSAIEQLKALGHEDRAIRERSAIPIAARRLWFRKSGTSAR
jgi:hypothetical protein